MINFLKRIIFTTVFFICLGGISETILKNILPINSKLESECNLPKIKVINQTKIDDLPPPAIYFEMPKKENKIFIFKND